MSAFSPHDDVDAYIASLSLPDDVGRLDVRATAAALPTFFAGRRHGAPVAPVAGPGTLTPWRSKDRTRTVAVGLVLCLNIGTDPPDVVKVTPCARTECWVDPQAMTPPKALEAIGAACHAQYDVMQPKARYKLCLDPTVESLRKMATGLRKTAKTQRVLLHFNGHGVPRPTSNGEIWVFNSTYTQYMPLSVYELQAYVGQPALFVFDCSSAGTLLPHFTSGAAEAAGASAGGRHRPAPAPAPSPGAAPGGLEWIVLAACSPGESLPTSPDLPADLFTACLTTPIQMALRWFIQGRSLVLPRTAVDLVDRLPGKVTERKSVKGQLNWVFTTITDTIAWSVLPKPMFLRLFRQDLLVASLFRNFLLADRIMRVFGCTPMSLPKLPPTHEHPLWESWDLAVEMALAHLSATLPPEPPKVPTTGGPQGGAPLPVPVPVDGAGALGAGAGDGGPDTPSSKRSKKSKSKSRKDKGKKKKDRKKDSSSSRSRKGESRSRDTAGGAGAPSPLAPEDKCTLPLSFFEEQLTAFEVWLAYGNRGRRREPYHMPVVLQGLLSDNRRRALQLLACFMDMGPWAVNLSLVVGVFPYMMRLMETATPDLHHILVFVWSKIMATDTTCQTDLVTNRQYMFFIRYLEGAAPPPPLNGGGDAEASPAVVPAAQFAEAVFVLCTMMDGHPPGQLACLLDGLLPILVRTMGARGALYRTWACLAVGKLCTQYDAARRGILGLDSPAAGADPLLASMSELDRAAVASLPGMLVALLTDKEVTVRAAACFALGALIRDDPRSVPPPAAGDVVSTSAPAGAPDTPADLDPIADAMDTTDKSHPRYFQYATHLADVFCAWKGPQVLRHHRDVADSVRQTSWQRVASQPVQSIAERTATPRRAPTAHLTTPLFGSRPRFTSMDLAERVGAPGKGDPSDSPLVSAAVADSPKAPPASAVPLAASSSPPPAAVPPGEAPPPVDSFTGLPPLDLMMRALSDGAVGAATTADATPPPSPTARRAPPAPVVGTAAAVLPSTPSAGRGGSHGYHSFRASPLPRSAHTSPAPPSSRQAAKLAAARAAMAATSEAEVPPALPSPTPPPPPARLPLSQATKEVALVLCGLSVLSDVSPMVRLESLTLAARLISLPRHWAALVEVCNLQARRRAAAAPPVPEPAAAPEPVADVVDTALDAMGFFTEAKPPRRPSIRRPPSASLGTEMDNMEDDGQPLSRLAVAVLGPAAAPMYTGVWRCLVHARNDPVASIARLATKVVHALSACVTTPGIVAAAPFVASPTPLYDWNAQLFRRPRLPQTAASADTLSGAAMARAGRQRALRRALQTATVLAATHFADPGAVLEAAGTQVARVFSAARARAEAVAAGDPAPGGEEGTQSVGSPGSPGGGDAFFGDLPPLDVSTAGGGGGGLPPPFPSAAPLPAPLPRNSVAYTTPPSSPKPASAQTVVLRPDLRARGFPLAPPRLSVDLLAAAPLGAVVAASKAQTKLVQQTILKVPDSRMTSLVAFHPWDGTLVTVDDVNCIHVFDYVANSEKNAFKATSRHRGAGGPYHHPRLLTPGSTPGAGTPSTAASMALMDSALGATELKLPRSAGPVSSPGGPRSRSMLRGRSASVSTVGGGVAATPKAKARVTSILWVNEHDDPLLGVGTDDGVVRVWQHATQAGGAQSLVSAFRAMPEMVAGTKGSGLVMLWDAAPGVLHTAGSSLCLRSWDMRREQCMDVVPTGLESPVTAMASPFPGVGPVLVGFADGSLRVLDGRSRAPVAWRAASPGLSALQSGGDRWQALQGHPSWVVGVACPRSGSAYGAMSGSLSGQLSFWDLRRPDPVRSVNAVSSSIMTSMAVHDYAPVMAVGAHNQYIKLLSTAGDELGLIRYHDGFVGQRIGPVSCLAFHPHELLLGAGATDSIVGIFRGSSVL